MVTSTVTSNICHGYYHIHYHIQYLQSLTVSAAMSTINSQNLACMPMTLTQKVTDTELVLVSQTGHVEAIRFDLVYNNHTGRCCITHKEEQVDAT
uniref:Uncharacterized protein n=1 Tax=Arion vulgaris TaxID=1028688 RepID=A0A0B6YMU4_9EUPU